MQGQKVGGFYGHSFGETLQLTHEPFILVIRLSIIIFILESLIRTGYSLKEPVMNLW